MAVFADTLRHASAGHSAYEAIEAILRVWPAAPPALIFSVPPHPMWLATLDACNDVINMSRGFRIIPILNPHESNQNHMVLRE